MADIRKIAKDPDFQKLPIEEQRKAFSEYDQDFSSLPVAEQDRGIAELISAKEAPPSPIPNESTGDYLRRLVAKITPYARPVLEYGGATAGSMLTGGPLTPTGIAGGALGYAGGRQGANLLEQIAGQRNPEDVLTELSRAGKDVSGGAMQEMITPVGGTLLSKLGGKLADTGVGKWLYSKALKTPLSADWKRTIPTKDYTKRELAVNTGMKDEIIPNELGKQKIIKRVNEISDEVKKTVDDLTAKGGNETNVYNLTKQALDPVKSRGAMARDSKAAKQNISEIEQDVINKGGVSASLNPSQLQTLKQEFYKDINWDKTKPIINEKGRFTEEATKAIALKAMERLEQLAPELKHLNKTEGAYIDLQKAVEHTIARYDNVNAIGLGAKILSLRNVGLAALETVTGTPAMKARIGIALAKAGNVGKGKVSESALRSAAISSMREND